jgi:hypothetical protein
MITVKFNEPDEFIQELQKDYPDRYGGRPIIRLTGLIKNARLLPIRHLYLAASIINPRDQIVKLEKYCGDLWGSNTKSDQDSRARYDELYGMVKKAAEDLNLEVRGGVFEEEADAGK